MDERLTTLDAFPPAEIAKKYVQIGVTKATLPVYKTLLLSLLAGAFIAFGCMYYITATTDPKLGYGFHQVLGGSVFTLGLILVSVAGGELFTGNALATIAVASGKISVGQLIRNWVLVWLGNLVGAVLVAALAYGAQHWTGSANAVGARALYVGAYKSHLPWLVIFYRGIFANALVCLAVWIAAAGRTAADKVIAMLFPIGAFVALGMEHSVANMFFIAYALFLRQQPALVAMPGTPSLASLNLAGYLNNLGASTLGNIVGGGILVGLVYWWVYLWPGPNKTKQEQ